MDCTLKTVIFVTLLFMIDSSENIVLRNKQPIERDNIAKATNVKNFVKKIELSADEFESEGSGEVDFVINKTEHSSVATSRKIDRDRNDPKSNVSNETVVLDTGEKRGPDYRGLNNGFSRTETQKRVDPIMQKIRKTPHRQEVVRRVSEFDYLDYPEYQELAFANAHLRIPSQYNRFDMLREPLGYYLPYHPWIRPPNQVQHPRVPLPPINPYGFYNPYAMYYNPWVDNQKHISTGQTGPTPNGYQNSTLNAKLRYNGQDEQPSSENQLPETSESDPIQINNQTFTPVSRPDPSIPKYDFETTSAISQSYEDDRDPYPSDPYQHTTPSANCLTTSKPPRDPYEQSHEQPDEVPNDPYQNSEENPYDANPAENYDPHPEQESHYENPGPRPEDQEAYNDHDSRRPPFNRPGYGEMMQRPYQGTPPMRRPYYGPPQQGYRPPDNYYYGPRYGGLASIAIIISVALLFAFLIIASASLTSGRSLNMSDTTKYGNIKSWNKTESWHNAEQAYRQIEICNSIENLCYITRYVRQVLQFSDISHFFHESNYGSDRQIGLGFFIGHSSASVFKNCIAFECPHLQPLC